MFQPLSEVVDIKLVKKYRPVDPSIFWEMDQIPTEEGMMCNGPGCSNVHGNRMKPKHGKKKRKKDLHKRVHGMLRNNVLLRKMPARGLVESQRQVQRGLKETQGGQGKEKGATNTGLGS